MVANSDGHRAKEPSRAGGAPHSDQLQVPVEEYADRSLIAKAMLAAIKSVVPGRCAVYVSAPITTGPRYLPYLKQTQDSQLPDGLREELRQSTVIQPNLRAAALVVRRVRNSFSHRSVIDPTELEEVPGWGQHDYHYYWTQVIGRFAERVVFVDGWEFSIGCTIEFAEALKYECHLYRQDLQSLAIEEADYLLSKAHARLSAVGASVEPILAARMQIKEYLREERQ